MKKTGKLLAVVIISIWAFAWPDQAISAQISPSRTPNLF
jgi:hypothetical protein